MGSDTTLPAPQNRRLRHFFLACLAHLPVALWLFRGPLFEGRVLYFRDLSSYYLPTYVFVERSLGQGVWPLWNPHSGAGMPFLMAYPVDLILLALFGAKATMALSPPLHLLLGMCGMTALGRRLGAGPWAAWGAGVFYGLSGFVLSSINLLQLLQAASWAPWLLDAFLRLPKRRGFPAVARLAALAAIAMSTLGGEILLQTALAALFLAPKSLYRIRVLGRLSLAAAMACLLAAPVFFGASDVIEGSRRTQGFNPTEALAWSASPLVLVESLIPRFFGDAHTFSDVGFWGQPFFHGGYPYLISLYLSPVTLLLAARAGRGGTSARLWAIALLGVLLSLGSNGPFDFVLLRFMAFLRSPIKFFFLSTLALCLLACLGLDRLTRRQGRFRAWMLVPGALLLLAGTALLLWPDRSLSFVAGIFPPLGDPRAWFVARTAWPWSFVLTGLACLGSAACWCASPRIRPLAGILAAGDLLLVNGGLNPSAPRDFYELNRPLEALVREVQAEGPFRWFSFGVANSPGIHWAVSVARRNSDVSLYYMDRQSLWGFAGVLDGLDGAFEEDRGWAPPGSALSPAESSPALYRVLHHRLRLAGVGWVLSFMPLPSDLVSLRGKVAFPEIAEPLGLYEIRNPLPRVTWVPGCQVFADGVALRRRLEEESFDPTATVLFEEPTFDCSSARGRGGSGHVSWERPDPHTIVLRSFGSAGLLLIVEGYHRHWRVQGEQAVRILRANGRYSAIVAPGGERSYVIRYRPPWRAPALATSFLIGLLMLCGCLVGAKRLFGSHAGLTTERQDAGLPTEPRSSAQQGSGSEST